MEGSPDVDSSAAALILTSYLERMQNPSTTPSDDQSQEPGEAQDRDTVPQEPAVIPLVAPEPAAETAPTVEKFISIDDFAKVQIKVGTVLSAERVPDTEKLLRLMIDLGEPEPRQIVSGIASYVAEPEKLRGLESNGMLFAVGEGETFAFMTPDGPVPPGTSAH
jgi:methionyl-tRNA synthetase